jgi:hypothetical protein
MRSGCFAILQLVTLMPSLAFAGWASDGKGLPDVPTGCEYVLSHESEDSEEFALLEDRLPVSQPFYGTVESGLRPAALAAFGLRNAAGPIKVAMEKETGDLGAVHIHLTNADGREVYQRTVVVPPVFVWKQSLGDDDQSMFRLTPSHSRAEKQRLHLGFRPGDGSGDMKYLSIRDTENGRRLTIGLDVDCDDIQLFTDKNQLERVLVEKGVLCRITVITVTLPLTQP